MREEMIEEYLELLGIPPSLKGTARRNLSLMSDEDIKKKIDAAVDRREKIIKYLDRM